MPRAHHITVASGGKLDHETSDKVSILVADPRRHDEAMLESLRKSCKGEAVVVTHEWLRLVSETRVWTDPIGSKYGKDSLGLSFKVWFRVQGPSKVKVH